METQCESSEGVTRAVGESEQEQQSRNMSDGLSMGMGDFLSSQAEIDYTASERKREAWEMEVNMSQTTNIKHCEPP